MICKKCGTKMEMQKGVVYTSLPPMYGFVCPKCGAMDYSHTPEYDDDPAAVPPTEEQIRADLMAELEKPIKAIISKTREEKLNPLISQMTKTICDAFEAGFDAGMQCGKFVDYKKAPTRD